MDICNSRVPLVMKMCYKLDPSNHNHGRKKSSVHAHFCSTVHKLLILKHNTTHSTQQLKNNYCKLFCQASFFLLNTFNFPFWHEDRRAISVFSLHRMQNVHCSNSVTQHGLLWLIKQSYAVIYYCILTLNNI